MARSAPRATAMSSWNMRAASDTARGRRRMIGEQLEQRQTQDHRRLVRCLRSARTQRLIAAMAGWIRRGAWLERYKRRKDAEALAILLRARTQPVARTAGPQGETT